MRAAYRHSTKSKDGVVTMRYIQRLVHPEFSIILGGLQNKTKWSRMKRSDPLDGVETPVLQVSRADPVSLFPPHLFSRQLFADRCLSCPFRSRAKPFNSLEKAAGRPPEVCTCSWDYQHSFCVHIRPGVWAQNVDRYPSRCAIGMVECFL